MKIPVEVLLPHFNESDRLAEGQGPKPVDSLSGLRADLPDSFPTPMQAFADKIKRLEQVQKRRHNSGQHKPENGFHERRHEERREKNIPVTLDTRLTRSRRKSACASMISIKI